MASDKPEKDKKKDKKDKKEKKEKKEKRAEEDGVKKVKSDKDKKEKKKKHKETEAALEEATQDAMEVDVAERVVIASALVPFANPLADEKQHKKLLKAVKKGTCATICGIY
jgi:H/ACA ribonucleoprotein complex subunit 2